MIITIDGPAGTGKTTVARRIAEKLNYHYFDTGAMYRAVTYGVLKENIDLKDHVTLNEFLDKFQFDIRIE
ncbi:MAG: (d)CMP kinase, partial [Chlamydiales bacterium]